MGSILSTYVVEPLLNGAAFGLGIYVALTPLCAWRPIGVTPFTYGVSAFIGAVLGSALAPVISLIKATAKTNER